MGIKAYVSGLLLLLAPLSAGAQYTPDCLGADYQSRTIRMPDDYEGKVVCTLIRKPALPEVKQAFLYIHGYNDYFFQAALGDSIRAWGQNFYALDLRKYGRSLLPHQDAFFCKDLTEYFADIDTAIAIIRQEGNERIILMGHSTGGLITSLYLDARKELPVNGLILNSPFLDMYMSPMAEAIGLPLISFLGWMFPRWVIQGTGSNRYAQTLLAEYRGEWTFNTTWKKENGHPKRAGWLRAIHQGHRKVQKKVELHCPILLLSSDKSASESADWAELCVSDMVLDVEDIQRYGARLGDKVTRHRIPDGVHDLILSQPEPRKYTYKVMAEWLKSLSLLP